MTAGRAPVASTGADAGRPGLLVASFDSLWGLTRHIATGGIAGLITGIVVAGLGGRLFMRIAGATARPEAQGARTEAGFTVGEITFGGTVGLVLFVGIVAGIVGAVLYLVFRPWLSWAGSGRGVAFGVVLFALTSATSDVLNPDNIDFFILQNEVLLVALIAGLFLAFGITIELLYGMLDRRLPPATKDHPSPRALYVALTILGVGFGALTLPPLLFTRSFCDCDPPIVAGGFLLLAGAATLLAWVAAIRPGSRWMVAVARILGYAGTIGVVGFGLFRAAGDAVRVIT